MRRRSFFGALFGAPVTTTLTAAGPEAETEVPCSASGVTVLASQTMVCAKCGMHMLCRGDYHYRFFSCMYLGCPRYDIPVLPTELQTRPADPAQVARIRADEARDWALDRAATELHDAIVEDPNQHPLLALAPIEVQNRIRFKYGLGWEA